MKQKMMNQKYSSIPAGMMIQQQIMQLIPTDSQGSILMGKNMVTLNSNLVS